MSKDIRSFFPTLSKKVVNVPKSPNDKTTANSKTIKRSFSSIGSSSEEVIPGTPQQLKKRKTTAKDNSGSKRKRIICVSSDSEPETHKKKGKASNKTGEQLEDIAKQSKKQAEPVKQKTTNLLAENVKYVDVEAVKQKKISALEAFGDEPVKQEKLSNTTTEIGIHEDDAFEQTLLQLDEEELVNAAESNTTAESRSDSTPQKTPAKTRTNTTPASRKKKATESESGMDPDQERHEKKRYCAIAYQKFLNRSGPAHPGSKWIPHGKPDCLKGLSFLVSGVLDSLDRDEAKSLVEEHGGRCLKSISGKVNYMVVGEDAGSSKLEKARTLGTNIISEDEFIHLICVKSNIKNLNATKDNDVVKEETKSNDTEIISNKKSTKEDDIILIPDDVQDKTKTNDPEKISNKKNIINKQVIEIDDEIPVVTVKQQVAEKKSNIFYKNATPSTSRSDDIEIRKANKQKKQQLDKIDMAWVDKYKPTDVSQIIGQQGENSNVKKLMNWMQKWHRNQNGKTKLIRPSPWAKNDDGAFFKAALLSGSPGVGKTTTATLVAEHLGFDTVEFNASDTRNKKMVHKEIAQILKSTSIAGFVTEGLAPTKKHVLLMDEVDGMSGNEDRGGIQELIGLIKDSQVPIICMCNDRQHPKIRTLANYCFDLRFSKPRVEQIRGAMLSICFKEHVKINADTMMQVIQGTGMDVRQTLNQLSMLAVNGNGVTSEEAGTRAKYSQKDSKLGPWEVIRKVFSEEEHKKMSMMDKSKLFFYDYSIGPLFVQENYLKVVPHCPKKFQLQRFADAADCISLGDLVDAKIRSTQNWSLLEMQAMYASVLPGHFLSGHFGGQIDFPGWLGKNSKGNKFQRMLTEVYGHTRTSTSGNRQALTLDYMAHIRDAIVFPLANEGTSGIPAAMRVMTDYKLLREDLTNIIELSHWPKAKDLFASVDSKVKAAFTRAYNNQSAVLPYSTQGAPVKKKLGAALNTPDELYDQYNVDSDEDEEKDDDIAADSMIKSKKPVSKTSKTESTVKSSKGKAKPKRSVK